jgi:hypothetical protein
MCDRWPIPPYWHEDYWALRELLGDDEFKRIVGCSRYFGPSALGLT